jgi:hypothetical protein
VTSGAPLPRAEAWWNVARCLATSARLLAQGRVHNPNDHVGVSIEFADGTVARVYRETTVQRRNGAPCVLFVGFRLRWVRGRGHALFRAESILNTPLFVGFPGFVSKLWLAHDRRGTYRGFYDWDSAVLATAYACSLWRILALVSVRGSTVFRVFPALSRDQVLDDPGILRGFVTDDDAWCRVVGSSNRAHPSSGAPAPRSL